MFAIRLLIIAIAAIVCAPAVSGAQSQRPRWEVVEAGSSDDSADQSDKVEVSVRDGYIYVTARRQVNVKVFTILGQLVSQGRLPAGTSRLRVGNKGIYILKTGSYTCRVTI